jgi:putative thioredoxin
VFDATGRRPYRRGMPSAHVLDVTAATFQPDVVERSMTTPVLLDFWAAWCGPCKTLGPVLERLAEAYGGAFVLGKVDSDREQDLAYAFGVQGIPFCALVEGGRPVDAFTGALPEAEVKRFLQRNGIEPLAVAPAPAADQAVVAKPAPVDPNSPPARLARARAAAAAGDAGGIRQALDGLPEEADGYDVGQRLLAGAEWLEQKLDGNGAAADRALLLARQRLVQRDLPGSMTALLDSVAADRTARGGLARKAMLLCFAVVGEDNELLDDYRRRLATLLY